MRALIHDPGVAHGLRLGEAPDPSPGAAQVLVRVEATSLNFGEVAFLADHVGAGEVAGWDAAGTAIAPAADGSGPPAASRVVTFGWANAWGPAPRSRRWPTSWGALRYEAVSDEDARAEMAGTTPQPYIGASFRFYSEGEFDDSRVVGTVAELTGRAPRRFEDWARDHVAAFAPAPRR